MTRRERDTFLALADAVVAPEPPLPPVADTDAAAGFSAWLVHGAPLPRAGMRAALAALAPLRRRDRGARLAALKRLGPLGEGLRSAAAMSYYGDPRVARLVEGAR